MPKCNEEGCKVLTTGECINGLDLSTCPHYSEANSINDENLNAASIDVDEDEDDIDTSAESKILQELIRVYSGQALSSEEANNISSASMTRLVLLAGMPDSGKTTLILSLMHLFQTRPSFEGYLFAGSTTLLSFEERSHPSKLASERENADTPRTAVGKPMFLHLEVLSETMTEDPVNLLFTDIAGETFKDLVDYGKDAKEFHLATRADHLVLFFDAKRLTSLSARASSKTAGIGILRSLIEAGVLKPHTSIQVIFSRWDIYKEQQDNAENDVFIKTIEEDISRNFGGLYDIQFFEVSARPKKGVLPFGYGLDLLFQCWVKKSISDTNKIRINAFQPNSHKHFFSYQFNQRST